MVASCFHKLDLSFIKLYLNNDVEYDYIYEYYLKCL